MLIQRSIDRLSTEYGGRKRGSNRYVVSGKHSDTGSKNIIRTILQQLEEEGLVRTAQGEGRVVTDEGRSFLDNAAADVLDGTGSALAGEELLGTLKGTGRARQALRIGALATLSRNFQLEFLRPILGRSDVEVILRSGGPAELLQALEALSLDVVLINRAPARDAVTPFVSHRLAEQPASLVGTPARLKDGGGSLAELLGAHPLILPTFESNVRIGFDALTDRLGVRPQIAAEIDDMAMMRLLTREGIGLAVLPPIVVKDELEAGLLVEADRLPGISETFYAVTMERRFPNPLLRALLQPDESALPG